MCLLTRSDLLKVPVNTDEVPHYSWKYSAANWCDESPELRLLRLQGRRMKHQKVQTQWNTVGPAELQHLGWFHAPGVKQASISQWDHSKNVAYVRTKYPNMFYYLLWMYRVRGGDGRAAPVLLSFIISHRCWGGSRPRIRLWEVCCCSSNINVVFVSGD